MELSICSYSFHRLLADGKQDMFKYITDCKELGCTQLDPWNAHFAGVPDAETFKKGCSGPDLSVQLSAREIEYLDSVKAAAEAVRLPFGCIAVDGAHIYEPTPEARKANRAFAGHWLEIAGKLGAKQVRIDCGGSAEMPLPSQDGRLSARHGDSPETPADMFNIIVEGYKDLIKRAGQKKLEVLIENHWAASIIPEKLVKILDAVPGLVQLFDTNNWAEGMKQKGWEMCAKYARATHVKTFSFDKDGNEPSVDIPGAIRILVNSGYKGCWGVESCPEDGDEYAGVRKTFELIKQVIVQ